MTKMTPVTKIARKHILAAIEAAPCDLEFKRYWIHAVMYRRRGDVGDSGVRVSWTIK